jgi:hypothetical protein
MPDANLDLDARNEAFSEAREQIHAEFSLGEDRVPVLEIDRILNDLKRRLLKKMN